MMRKHLIAEVQKLRRKGDPLVPFDKAELEQRLWQYRERESREALAREHAAADAECGRDWHSEQGCGCATCRMVKSEVKL
jgi:hypothetical protein